MNGPRRARRGGGNGGNGEGLTLAAPCLSLSPRLPGGAATGVQVHSITAHPPSPPHNRPASLESMSQVLSEWNVKMKSRD